MRASVHTLCVAALMLLIAPMSSVAQAALQVSSVPAESTMFRAGPTTAPTAAVGGAGSAVNDLRATLGGAFANLGSNIPKAGSIGSGSNIPTAGSIADSISSGFNNIGSNLGGTIGSALGSSIGNGQVVQQFTRLYPSLDESFIVNALNNNAATVDGASLQALMRLLINSANGGNIPTGVLNGMSSLISSSFANLMASNRGNPSVTRNGSTAAAAARNPNLLSVLLGSTNPNNVMAFAGPAPFDLTFPMPRANISSSLPPLAQATTQDLQAFTQRVQDDMVEQAVAMQKLWGDVATTWRQGNQDTALASACATYGLGRVFTDFGDMLQSYSPSTAALSELYGDFYANQFASLTTESRKYMDSACCALLKQAADRNATMLDSLLPGALLAPDALPNRRNPLTPLNALPGRNTENATTLLPRPFSRDTDNATAIITRPLPGRNTDNATTLIPRGEIISAFSESATVGSGVAGELLRPQASRNGTSRPGDGFLAPKKLDENCSNSSPADFIRLYFGPSQFTNEVDNMYAAYQDYLTANPRNNRPTGLFSGATAEGTAAAAAAAAAGTSTTGATGAAGNGRRGLNIPTLSTLGDNAQANLDRLTAAASNGSLLLQGVGSRNPVAAAAADASPSG